MEPMTAGALAEAVGGRWIGPPSLSARTVAEVSTDSRAIRPGALFVPLTGRHFDGRAFIDDAIRRGAAAAFWERGWTEPPPAAAPLIEVDDSMDALERLARAWRSRLEAEVFGITGTVGKTSTKEFLATLLSTRLPTVRAPRSYNNRLGVVLTLLEAGPEARAIVCELGTSAPGELTHLSRLARPSRIVITEIGRAHLAGLGDLDGVIRAKAEVFEGLAPGGTAYIQEGAPGRERLAAAARAAGGDVVLFGWERADFVITGCRRLERGDVDLPAGQVPVGFRFRLRDPQGFEEELILPLPGRHNVLNVLGAVAAARGAGLDWAAIRAAVRELALPPRRFAVGTAGGVTIIDDTYNASQRSVLAALDEAGEITLPPGGRRFLVLGDLLELGEASAEIHRGIGRCAVERGFQGLVAVGRESRHAAEAARESAGTAPFLARSVVEVDEAPGVLEEILVASDLALFKASRAMGLERVVEEVRRRLLARPRGEHPPEPVPTEGGRAACSTISIS